MSNDKAELSKPISDKRGTGPIKVLKVSDVSHIDSPHERTEVLLENRNDIFIYNLKYLCKIKNITQVQLCADKLGGLITPPQLTSYKKRGRDIPMRIIIAVANAFGIDMEDMCGCLLDQISPYASSSDQTNERPVEEYKKYAGTYDLAFFDTSKALGNNPLPAAKALNYAVLTIYALKNAVGAPTFHVTAIYNYTSEERQKVGGLLKNIDFLQNGELVYANYESALASFRGAEIDYSRMKYLYDGTIHLTEQMAEITLRQVTGGNVIHLLVHNRAATSSAGKIYQGGLATMMSVSRGAERMPCIQAALMMREISVMVKGDNPRVKQITKSRLDNYSKELLAQKLYLLPPKIELKQEINDIVTYMKFLFQKSDNYTAITGLRDEDKEFCLEAFVEKKLTDSLRRNIIGYYKIAMQMDSEIYQLIQEN